MAARLRHQFLYSLGTTNVSVFVLFFIYLAIIENRSILLHVCLYEYNHLDVKYVCIVILSQNTRRCTPCTNVKGIRIKTIKTCSE
jgi:hypothetical protein